MALSIKTAEADRLARTLARLTGETMTEAVTVALRERLVRETDRRKKDEDLPARLAEWARRYGAEYDTRPVTQEEWDWAGGDDWDLSLRDQKK
ncbi:MAG TPA: type II toxin-antitoxin system VapB family antitoxin [Stellaceae bacterium]|jgi:antitoxin VapB|nr:type II toxin-antitoxin system VapB family antitoxin [Stellaceae bacterium]